MKALVAEIGPDLAVSPPELRHHEVHRRRADELGDEEVPRALVQDLRRIDLLQQPASHDRDAVAHRHRFRLIVRHVDGRHAELALDTRDLGPHLDPQLRVEIGQRLVHEERLWVADDRAAHRDALALPSRERPRLLVQRVREPEDASRVTHPNVSLGLRDPAHPEGEPHVLGRGHVRVERVVLEDHGDVAVLRRKVVHHLAVDLHVPVRDRLEARDHAESRCLPAPGRADEDDELACTDLEIELGDGFRAVGVDLRETLEDDLGHAASWKLNLLASTGSHGGRRCAVETTGPAPPARPREPPRPRAAAHRPGSHLHGARRGRPVRLGDLPELHGCDRRLADR